MIKTSKTFFVLCSSLILFFTLLTGEIFAQTSYFFYSNIAVYPNPFNRLNSDKTGLITIAIPIANTLIRSAVDPTISKVYTVESDGTWQKNIYSMNYDGTGRTLIYSYGANGTIYAIAAGNGYVFFDVCDATNSVFKLFRMPSTGGTPSLLFDYLPLPAAYVQGLAFDCYDNSLYIYEDDYGTTAPYRNRIVKTDINYTPANTTEIYSSTIIGTYPSVLSLAAGGGNVYYAVDNDPRYRLFIPQK